ncbi:uncharacterized protein LOC121050271 [Rosa chinensis]|uniref:uncharacterized protein LOC121050271 n=1 Tax=Rosa chinensis TaxID=74649 RepID=UPI001AD921F8|nr:uncharacterized protein LOC121050271 [Rosa chinensis]
MEPEDNVLEKYERVLGEKRKTLAALKIKEKKVDLDKELKSIQQLTSKKTNDEIVIKLVINLHFILIILHFLQEFPNHPATLQLIVRVLKRINARKLLRRRKRTSKGSKYQTTNSLVKKKRKKKKKIINGGQNLSTAFLLAAG